MKLLIIAPILVLLPFLSWSQTSVSDEPTKEDYVKERWTVVDKVSLEPIGTVDVVKSSTTVGWRFTHNNGEVQTAPWYGGGTTWSQDSVIECDSLAQVLKVIETRKLKVSAEVQEPIDQLEEVDAEEPIKELEEPK